MHKSNSKVTLSLSLLYLFNSLNPCFSINSSEETEGPQLKKTLLKLPYIPSDPLFVQSIFFNSNPLSSKELGATLSRFSKKAPAVQNPPSPATSRLAAVIMTNDTQAIPTRNLWIPQTVSALSPAGFDHMRFTFTPWQELSAYILDYKINIERLRKEIIRLEAELHVKRAIKEALSKPHTRKGIGPVDYEKIEAELPEEVFKLISGKPGKKPSSQSVSIGQSYEDDKIYEDFTLSRRPSPLPPRVVAFNFLDNIRNTSLLEAIAEAKDQTALTSSVSAAIPASNEPKNKASKKHPKSSAIYERYVFGKGNNSEVALTEELSSLISTFQGLDPIGARESMLAQSQALLLENQSLDEELSKHKLPPFGIRLKKRNEAVTIDFRRPASVEVFNKSNTYSIENLSLRGDVLNSNLLRTLKSMRWTRDTKNTKFSVLGAEIAPHMENLRSLELEFDRFDSRALQEALSLSKAPEGIKSLSLSGKITADNFDTLSRLQPHPLQALERLEIHGIHPLFSVNDFITSLVRSLYYMGNLRSIELSFGDKNLASQMGDFEYLLLTLENSSPKLESLSINAHDIPEDWIERFKEKVKTYKKFSALNVTVQSGKQVMDKRPSNEDLLNDLASLASSVSALSTSSGVLSPAAAAAAGYVSK